MYFILTLSPKETWVAERKKSPSFTPPALSIMKRRVPLKYLYYYVKEVDIVILYFNLSKDRDLDIWLRTYNDTKIGC